MFTSGGSQSLDDLQVDSVWPEFISSSCLIEEASIVLQFGFLGVFLLQFIGNVFESRHKGREDAISAEKFAVGARVGLSYKLISACSTVLIGTHFFMLLMLQNDDASRCKVKFLAFSFEILHILCWAVSLAILYKILRDKHVKLPWVLRVWWISGFLLSIVSLVLDGGYVIHNHEDLKVQDFTDVLNLLASTCLFVVSVNGKTGLEFEIQVGITAPLLNGKTGNDLEENLGCLYGRATLLQLITFSWLNPLFKIGYEKPLYQEQVPDVDFRDSAHTLSPSFDDCLDHVKRKDGTTNPSIYKALYIFGRKKAAINAFFAVIGAATSYVGPYLINDLVEFLINKKSRSLRSGYLLALAFLSAKMVETIAQRQWIFGARQLGLRLRAALISCIYQKGLVLSSTSRQRRTSGEIINIMGVDVERISDFIWYMNMIWMLPIQISLAVYVLHNNLGWGSLIALAATLTVMCGNIPLTRTRKRFQGEIMKAKDDRMKVTSEVLCVMRTIKLQAWDNYFSQKLENLRKIEHHWLWKSLRLQTIIVFIFCGSPSFISGVTFVGCVLLGIPLTAGRVLSALATFRMLQDPMFKLPELLSVIIQGKVSADRIASYLHEDEIRFDSLSFIAKEKTEFSIEIDNGKFSWDNDSSNATLDGINLKVKRGMKVAICGTVGSGKSSLLSCILGEMSKHSGIVRISGTKAYVPQSPWILNGHVRENILFGSPFDNYKYLRTVEACALRKDFELFPAGDRTEIGERGINMSGGQKQRIQIARAMYQDADIYLLDDPFSAVDAHTGTQLFKDCLMGILKEKTIIYVTHQVEFLPAADLILVMQNGRIAHAGSYEELLEHSLGFEVLVGAHNLALQSITTAQNSNITLDTDLNSTSEFSQTKQDSKQNQCLEITEQDGRLVQEEERETGKIGREVYLSYLNIVKGGALVPIILLVDSFSQVLLVTSDYWMAWACPTGNVELVTGMRFILLVYILLAVGSSCCVLIRARLVAFAGLLTSQKLFSNMLNSIIHAPMSFFDSTPSGRILNRASTDQSVLDLQLPSNLHWCAGSMIKLLGTIMVMSQVAWEVFIIFIPITAICIWYQQYYIPTARELVRLAGIKRAPILHHFSESLAGAATIRAFDMKGGFIYSNLCLIDDHSKPWFHNLSAMEWFSFRLNQLSNFVFGFSLVLLVSLPEGIINPSIAGLAVTYGISLNGQLAEFIWTLCNVENKMISFERILQYSNIPSEAPLAVQDCRPPEIWPKTGTIQFINLKIRYSEHLPFVLKNITCTFPGKKKVGVVGRTGSGKSTLIQAIFRVVEPTEGSILIDGLDITKIGLHDLRSRLSIIPQDPTMFEGTVRRNLDPLEQYSDSEIWEALNKCQLGELVRSKTERLESTVVENGENWSVGQRQLFCLGRALLKKSTILVLDEATASVDSATDGTIQKIISQEFKDRTVITIAHRIHTVIDSDLVLVLSDGMIAEYDTPGKLLEREDSFFSRLIREYSQRSQSFGAFSKWEGMGTNSSDSSSRRGRKQRRRERHERGEDIHHRSKESGDVYGSIEDKNVGSDCDTDRKNQRSRSDRRDREREKRREDERKDRRRHWDEGEKETNTRRKEEDKNGEREVAGGQVNVKPNVVQKPENLGRSGGVYIPPFKLARMMKEVEDKASLEYQRMTWDALRKSINGLVNKVNAINIKNIIPELFAENLIRGRGLFCRSCMKSQMASPGFTDVFAALVAVANTKFPEVGELLLKRIILQLQRAYRRNDKPQLLAAVKFVAHLVNQQVVHELIALELLTVLLENPTDDSVEVAVGFVTECGSMLQDLCPKGLHGIFERFRGILHEGEIDKRVQFLIEGLFALRKAKFQGYPAVRPELDLVELEDQLTHEISLSDEIDPEIALDIFKPDPNFLENEKKYEELKKSILGDESDDEADSDGESNDDDSEPEEGSEEEEERMKIQDETETNLVNLRRTIYLTIMSSVDFEEAGHKLLKIKLEPGQEMELCIMLLECCSQERTYLRYYGLLGQRFCMINKVYQVNFETCFVQQYSMIHRLETNKLRNVAKFFAHLLGTDALPWHVLSYIRLTEEDTTSSSRIFIKILFQELSEHLGIRLLNERLNDPMMQDSYESIFPKDNPKNTRFSINFFTSIGLGGITENLREYLKNMPRLIMQQQQKPASDDESDSSGSHDSDSSSSSDDSDSESDSGKDDTRRKRKRRS
ncbi:OLC1v1001876C1 [Oldenlandia corymbosa var. corymbosa]|uniref:ABC-type xenobiotic transporter n=1 Tax=Oldenlandia corymbosa var. corymbosa TaxID=529605 RepID=A0AAV1D9R9_OLDCO|nr:OLC1v1001876C1 [Oldenlandia corymbosa var. corymbosa]